MDQPPKLAHRFLKWYCREEYLNEIEGDLLELFHLRLSDSPRRARLFFIWNVFRSFRLINLKKTQTNNWTMNMFKNYTKIYFRRFGNESIHYSVNLFGLAIGLTILFFILMFVYDERNMDDFHQQGDRIYRLVSEVQEDDGNHDYLSTPGRMADAIKEEFPSVEETAHLTYMGSQVMTVGETRLADREWAMGTASIFDILEFEIIDGNPKKSFNGEAGVVITEDLALRLFGKTDVVGEVLDEARFENVEVIALMKEMPRNSSYRFNAIYVINYERLSDGFQRYINAWAPFAQTWVLLKEGTNPDDLEPTKTAFLDKYVPEEARENYDFRLQNIEEMHLGSIGIETGGMNPQLAIPYSDREFVGMILLMGLLVIFIATLNYVNLSSVQALKRTLEASMRKINGATNGHLIGQLFFETFLTIFIAYVLAIGLILLLFPFFLDLANKDFSVILLFSQSFIAFHIATFTLIWVLSAIVPALYYSRLKRRLLIVKNAFSGKGDLLRKLLVSIQYALSIFLIIGSVVIYRQLNYVQSKDLGFNNSNLVVLDINSGTARESFKSILEGIRANSNVVSASTSSRVPGEWKNIPVANLATNLTDEAFEASHYGIDNEWLRTYGMDLKEGENFSGNDQVDSLSIIINSQAAEMLELENPIGERVWVMNRRDSVRMRVIGLVDDFHFESLYEPIKPVVLTSWNNHVRSIDYFTIRYNQNPKETTDHIVEVNAKFDPETPAEINFLDEQWRRFYKAEESRSMIMLIASIVSILISAFGLFGLINFTAERKTKEIGIRKVIGASVPNIITLILRDYIILLLIAMVVSAPLAYWLFQDWLADFAYRIQLSADVFLLAFGLVLLISLSTVVSRIYRVANGSPIKSIRYE